MKKYNPLYHSEKDCRNDHPTLNKVPVGFMGFHVEDYQDEIDSLQEEWDEWHKESNSTW